MKCSMVALSLLPAILVVASCSDEAEQDSIPPATAVSSQESAPNNTQESTQKVAEENASWLEQFRTLASSSQPEDALAFFETLKAEQADLLTSDNLLTMAAYAIEVAKSIELTQPILEYAIATYPAEVGKFGGIDAAIFRVQNPAAAELSIDGAHAPIEGAADTLDEIGNAIGSKADGALKKL